MRWTALLVGLLAVSAGCVVPTGSSAPATGTAAADGTPSATPVEDAQDSVETPSISAECRDVDSTESRVSGLTDTVTGAAQDRMVERVKTRALCAEERYLRERLQFAPCVDSWGAYNAGGSVAKKAEVRNRTADGVYVDVTHPYWWGNGAVSSDDFSTATYLVTANETRRVTGQSVRPC